MSLRSTIISQNINNMEFNSPKNGDNNNEYPSSFKKDLGEKGANGMGLERGGEALNAFPGSEANGREELLKREVERFNELSSKAFSKDAPITNAGIPLDSFGGSFGE